MCPQPPRHEARHATEEHHHPNGPHRKVSNSVTRLKREDSERDERAAVQPAEHRSRRCVPDHTAPEDAPHQTRWRMAGCLLIRGHYASLGSSAAFMPTFPSAPANPERTFPNCIACFSPGASLAPRTTSRKTPPIFSRTAAVPSPRAECRELGSSVRVRRAARGLRCGDTCSSLASIAASNRSATVPPASPSLAHSSDSSANRMYSASANSSLDAKYRYASPRLAPASCATPRIVVASYPFSANSPSAASRIRSLVRRAFGVKARPEDSSISSLC